MRALLFFMCLTNVAQAGTIAVKGTDSDAIAAAITSSQSDDTVAIPAGTYVIRQSIRPKSHTRLEGAGTDRTILRFQGESSAPIVRLDGCEDVEVCQLTLDGASSPNAAQGIAASNARRLNLHHLTIRDLVKSSAFGPHGILFAGANPTRENGVTDSEIADCRIENIAVDASFGGGVRLSWGSSRNRVLRNTIANTGRGGVFADNGSTDNLIQGNTVTGSHGEALGIEVWGGCDRCVIEDNRIDHWLSIGGCDYCAARRNTISDKSGEYKFCGIEGIGSYCVITDNTVDGGQKIGLSVSGSQPKQYVYWAHNTVRDCNQWGAQFQGEAGGIAYHYLYRCAFLAMPLGHGPVWYPGDEGHGFRTNGNVHDVVFEECAFSDNARLGLQLGGANVDALSFLRCTIRDNKGAAVRGPNGYSILEWIDCTVAGNAGNDLPPNKPFAGAAPMADFTLPSSAQAGKPLTFAHASPSDAAVLWDFGDGAPVIAHNPTHVYAKSGDYAITLIVWHKQGRAGRVEKRLTVTP